MTEADTPNSLNCLECLTIDDKAYTYHSLKIAEKTLGDLSGLPGSMRVLLENLIRCEKEAKTTIEDMRSLCAFYATPKNPPVVAFIPARVLIHDEDAVSIMTDWAALREETAAMGESPELVVPSCPVDIVIDQTEPPFLLGRERLELLKWAEKNLAPVRIVPPGRGAGSAVNLDFLSQAVNVLPDISGQNGLVVPETCVGPYSRLGSLGALGGLGWQTDPLDLESVMLGGALNMTLPGVIGVKLTGKPRKGACITDIALALTSALASSSLNGKIVEFYGSGLDTLSVMDRAVIANFLCDAGTLSTYFPIDRLTLDYLTMTGNTPHHIALVEAYAKAQGLWRESGQQDVLAKRSFTETRELEIDTLRPGVTGLSDKFSHTPLVEAAMSFAKAFPAPSRPASPLAPVHHGDIVWASIASCGNTAHVREMILAGLVARKAKALGLTLKPWVKASLNLASPIIQSVLKHTGLLDELEGMGFKLTGAGCAGCRSCPAFTESVASAISRDKIVVASLTSSACHGGCPPPDFCSISATASPGLVIAYAIAGNIGADLANKPINQKLDGSSAYLKDLWPSTEEIDKILALASLPELYSQFREQLFRAGPEWDQIQAEEKPLYNWLPTSTYVRRPPTVPSHPPERAKIRNIADARILAVFGDDVLAVQISPSGPISSNDQAGAYLRQQGVQPSCLGTYDQRKGHFEVMLRGAMHGRSLENALTPGSPEGLALYAPTKDELWIHEVAERYQQDKKPLILAGGKNFGSGTGQEWAAKTIRLLGVQAVIAESFDPSFRLNLIRVGVLPLRLKAEITIKTLNLHPQDVVGIYGLSDIDRLPPDILATFEQSDGVNRFVLTAELLTEQEVTMVRHGGMWAHFIRTLIPLAV